MEVEQNSKERLPEKKVVEWISKNSILILCIFSGFGYTYLDGYLSFFRYGVINICDISDIIFVGFERYIPSVVVTFCIALLYNPFFKIFTSIAKRLLSLITWPFKLIFKFTSPFARKLKSQQVSKLLQEVLDDKKYVKRRKTMFTIVFWSMPILFFIPLIFENTNPKHNSYITEAVKSINKSTLNFEFLNTPIHTLDQSRDFDEKYTHIKEYKEQLPLLLGEKFKQKQFVTKFSSDYYRYISYICAFYLLIYFYADYIYPDQLKHKKTNAYTVLAFMIMSFIVSTVKIAKYDAGNILLNFEKNNYTHPDTTGTFDVSGICTGRGRVLFNGNKTIITICGNKLIYTIKNSPISSSRDMFADVN